MAFVALLIKNALISFRRPGITLTQLLLPTLMAVILLLPRFFMTPRSIKPKSNVQTPLFVSTFTQETLFYTDLSAITMEKAMDDDRAKVNIYYYPNPRGLLLPKLLEVLMERHKIHRGVAKGFETKEELEEACLASPYGEISNILFTCIEFDDVLRDISNPREWPNITTVKIRMPAEIYYPYGSINYPAFTPLFVDPIKRSWRTGQMSPSIVPDGPLSLHEDLWPYDNSRPDYLRTGFLWTQYWIWHAFVNFKVNDCPQNILPPKRIRYNPQPFPDVEFKLDPMGYLLHIVLHHFILIAFFFSTVYTAYLITQEKELLQKELLRTHGASAIIQWLALLTSQIIIMAIACLCMLLVLTLPIRPVSPALNSTATQDVFTVRVNTTNSTVSGGHLRAVLNKTRIPFLMVMFLPYILASTCFALMVSAFCDKTSTAVLMTSCLWFLTIIPYMICQSLKTPLSFWIVIIVSKFHNSLMCFMVQLLAFSESGKSGFTWLDLSSNKKISPHSNFTIIECILSMLVDAILYFAIASCMDDARPGRYGMRRGLFYSCTKNSWLNQMGASSINKPKRINDGDYEQQKGHYVAEEDPKNLNPAAEMYKVSKKDKYKFDECRMNAVDNVTLRCYDQQTTVILGHNNSGKSILMYILTGWLNPTRGKVYVQCRDMVTETREAKRFVGFCPQPNVLFKELTCREHIQLFSRVRNIKRDIEVSHIEDVLYDMNMMDKMDRQVKYLDHGIKRRMCISQAFIGLPKVVFLDEPTNGLDPTIKTSFYSMLKRHKRSRSIVIATKSTSTADFVADRIILLSSGQVKAVGTPMYLKRRFNNGYRLTVITNLANPSNRKINELVKNHVPCAKTDYNIGKKISYIIPFSDSKSNHSLLKKLESKKDSLSINSYRLTNNTLEDVFQQSIPRNLHLKPGPIKGKSKELKWDEHGCDAERSSSDDDWAQQNDGILKKDTSKSGRLQPTYKRQYKSMFKKFYKTKRRNLFKTLLFIIVPLLFAIACFVACRFFKRNMKKQPSKLLKINNMGLSRTVSLKSWYEEKPLLSDENYKVLQMYEKIFEDFPPKTHMVRSVQPWNYSVPKYYQRLHLNEMKNEYSIREIVAGLAAGNEDTNRTIHYSHYYYHTEPIALDLTLNAWLRRCGRNWRYDVINDPLPLRNGTSAVNSEVYARGQMIHPYTFLFGYATALVSGVSVMMMAKERGSGAQFLQRLAGLNSGPLFFGTGLMEFLYFLLCLVPAFVLLMAGTFCGISLREILLVLLALFLFGLFVIPFSYIITLCLPNAPLAYLTVVTLFLLTGIITHMAYLGAYYSSKTSSNILSRMFVDTLFIWFPPYDFVNHMWYQSRINYNHYACKKFCKLGYISEKKCNDDYLCLRGNSECCPGETSKLGALKYIPPLFFSALLAWLCLWIIRGRFFRPKETEKLGPLNLPELCNCGEEAPGCEVSMEKDLVANVLKFPDRLRANPLVTHDLVKNVGGNKIVDDVSLVVTKDESLGLMGWNGSGKTALIREVVGSSRIDSGNAWIKGIDVKTHYHAINTYIGYCPRPNTALFGSLTGRETVIHYCNIRGVVSYKYARDLSRSLGMKKVFDKPVRKYSESDKRKLLILLSLLGTPRLLVFDEPTFGLDKAGQKQAWSVMADAIPSLKCSNIKYKKIYNIKKKTIWSRLRKRKGKKRCDRRVRISDEVESICCVQSCGDGDCREKAAEAKCIEEWSAGPQEIVTRSQAMYSSNPSETSGSTTSMSSAFARKPKEPPGFGMLLSSHSMDEVETMCSRLGVMRDGHLLYLGSPQYLQSKYSAGYMVTVRSPTRAVKSVHKFITSKYSQAELLEKQRDTNGNIVSIYYIDIKNKKIPEMFNSFEKNRGDNQIVNYVVEESSTKQFFSYVAPRIDSSDNELFLCTYCNTCE